jgi:hypothetical protein
VAEGEEEAANAIDLAVKHPYTDPPPRPTHRHLVGPYKILTQTPPFLLLHLSGDPLGALVANRAGRHVRSDLDCADEVLDPALDLVADASYLAKRPAFGIGEVPVWRQTNNTRAI